MEVEETAAAPEAAAPEEAAGIEPAAEPAMGSEAPENEPEQNTPAPEPEKENVRELELAEKFNQVTEREKVLRDTEESNKSSAEELKS